MPHIVILPVLLRNDVNVRISEQNIINNTLDVTVSDKTEEITVEIKQANNK